ncbi:MAG TPA: hypothetical protein PL131_09465 [Methylotenera sp.]|nr:hypothetical protein [Methylotenera sp.]HPH06090.1 hypothetical protein [Methylotenera sp.]
MKSLLDNYLKNSTFNERNKNPLKEGVIATLSDMLEREDTAKNLPLAFDKLLEFHLSYLDRSKFKDSKEHENTAILATLCFSMIALEKNILNKNKGV